MHTDTATILPFARRHQAQGAGAARANVRLEPTRRGRRVLTVIAFVLGLVVAAGVLLTIDLPSALAGNESAQSVTVTVEPGDTLWGLAADHAPEGMSEQEFVNEVRGLNQLPTGRVTAGQQIELPASGTTVP